MALAGSARDGWTIALYSWIIQDGNYPDFVRGQHADFAVEFEIENLDLTESAVPSATLVDDSCYEIVGRVVGVYPTAWVVDCGILIYQERQPPGVAEDDWVSGRAVLGVDPFAYYERLNRLPGMPALIYSWRIDSIRRQTAPFVEIAPRTFARDTTKWGFVDAERTDAWQDDNGRADYLLDCRRRDTPPRRSRSDT